MKRIVINGDTITYAGEGKNIVISNENVIVDGNIIKTDIGSNAQITIYGSVKKIECTGSVEVHGNSGEIDCRGCCTVGGAVIGNIDCGGSVQCGEIFGAIDAGGGVKSIQKKI